MVDEDPLESYENGALAFCVTGVRKIPNSTGSRHHKLRASNNESIHPE